MVNEMHQKDRFPRKAIFNIDETKWFIKRGKIIRQVVGSPGGKQNLEESRSQTVASSVQVVSADGTGFLQAIIFKAGKWQAKVDNADDDDDEPTADEANSFFKAMDGFKLDENEKDVAQEIDGEQLDDALKEVKFGDVRPFNGRSQRSGGFMHTVVYFTEIGCANNVMLGDFFDLFVELWKADVGDADDREAALNALVFLDNLGAHMAGDAGRAIIEAAEQRVYFRFFPANATHVMQPLDALVFAMQKRVLALFVARRQRQLSLTGRTPKHLLFPILRQVQIDAVTVVVIQGAFKRAFICPWQPDMMLAAVLKNNGGADATPSKLPNPVLAAVVESVRSVVANDIQEAKRLPDSMQLTASVKKNTRYTTFDLTELAERNEREKAAAAATKAATKEVKVAKKPQEGSGGRRATFEEVNDRKREIGIDSVEGLSMLLLAAKHVIALGGASFSRSARPPSAHTRRCADS